jgi:hypothetical protein
MDINLALFKLAMQNPLMVQNNGAATPPNIVVPPGTPNARSAQIDRKANPSRYRAQPSEAREKHDPFSWLRNKEQESK